MVDDGSQPTSGSCGTFGPVVTVRMAEFLDGPRHRRLRKIWRAISASEPLVHLDADQGKYPSHEALYNELWSKDCPSRFLLLTEEDFLPNLETDWTSTKTLLGGADLVACEYRMRTPLRMLEEPKGIVGGWYLAFHLDALVPKTLRNLPVGSTEPAGMWNPGDRPFDFGGKDCGNRLQEQIAPGKLVFHDGSDGLHNVDAPRHFGIEYPFGVHLFWSRHLHDDPHLRVGGIALGDVQEAHDARVEQWLRDAPESFHLHYQE